jgi:hypothetical protein
MGIDVIAVAVAFIAMAALVVVLMRGKPLFHAGRQSVYFLAAAARACRVWCFNGGGQQFFLSREQLSHAGEK